MIARNPLTPEEWQEAVDSAQFLLLLESAKLYGLIETEIEVDRIRCEWLLERGRGKGYRPATNAELVRRYLRQGIM